MYYPNELIMNLLAARVSFSNAEKTDHLQVFMFQVFRSFTG